MGLIIATVLKELPGIIDLIKASHAQANPDALPLTDAEVIAALKSNIDASIMKDDAITKAHGG